MGNIIEAVTHEDVLLDLLLKSEMNIASHMFNKLLNDFKCGTVCVEWQLLATYDSVFGLTVIEGFIFLSISNITNVTTIDSNLNTQIVNLRNTNVVYDMEISEIEDILNRGNLLHARPFVIYSYNGQLYKIKKSDTPV